MDPDVRTGVIILTFTLAGVLMAAIVETLITQGIMLDEFVTGSITSPDIMAMIIIIWILVGVIVGVGTRGRG